jgi:hypothetical protein
MELLNRIIFFFFPNQQIMPLNNNKFTVHTNSYKNSHSQGNDQQEVKKKKPIRNPTSLIKDKNFIK